MVIPAQATMMSPPWTVDAVILTILQLLSSVVLVGLGAIQVVLNKMISHCKG